MQTNNLCRLHSTKNIHPPFIAYTPYARTRIHNCNYVKCTWIFHRRCAQASNSSGSSSSGRKKSRYTRTETPEIIALVWCGFHMIYFLLVEAMYAVVGRIYPKTKHYHWRRECERSQPVLTEIPFIYFSLILILYASSFARTAGTKWRRILFTLETGVQHCGWRRNRNERNGKIDWKMKKKWSMDMDEGMTRWR